MISFFLDEIFLKKVPLKKKLFEFYLVYVILKAVISDRSV